MKKTFQVDKEELYILCEFIQSYIDRIVEENGGDLSDCNLLELAVYVHLNELKQKYFNHYLCFDGNPKKQFRPSRAERALLFTVSASAEPEGGWQLCCKSTFLECFQYVVR